MRFSKLFGKTLREAPNTVTRTAEQLAMRAALIRRVSSTHSFLPLGNQALLRIMQRAAQAIEALGGQQAVLNIQADDILAFKSDIASYRDLPRLVYHPANRVRFFVNLLEASAAEFETGFRNVYQALVGVMQSCGLNLSAVEAGSSGTRFIVPHPQGDTQLLICTSSACGYCSLADLAEFKVPPGPGAEPLPLTKVETPYCSTIVALAEYLKIETQQTIKAVLYMADEGEFIFVVIRGDLDVSEAKLLNVLHASHVRPATENEIVATGAVPGYASPTGLKVAANTKERRPGRVTVLADPSIQNGANFVAGANEAGYHFINVNYPRDFQVTLIADIALAKAGATCAQCGQPLRAESAFILGGCQNKGATALTYLSAAGRPESVWLGTFWLDPGAILLSVLDQHHDDFGIIWPTTIAPYDLHLVRLGKAPETIEVADKLYTDLQSIGKTVLYDDRDESAGVKFADADLIGLPLRLTVSDKGLKAGTVELKRRNSPEKTVVPLAEVLSNIQNLAL